MDRIVLKKPREQACSRPEREEHDGLDLDACAGMKLNQWLAQNTFLNPIHIADDCTHAAYHLCPSVREGYGREEVIMRLLQQGLPVSDPPLQAPLTVQLRTVLEQGFFCHPFHDRILAAALPCPIAEGLSMISFSQIPEGVNRT